MDSVHNNTDVRPNHNSREYSFIAYSAFLMLLSPQQVKMGRRNVFLAFITAVNLDSSFSISEIMSYCLNLRRCYLSPMNVDTFKLSSNRSSSRTESRRCFASANFSCCCFAMFSLNLWISSSRLIRSSSILRAYCSYFSLFSRSRCCFSSSLRAFYSSTLRLSYYLFFSTSSFLRFYSSASRLSYYNFLLAYSYRFLSNSSMKFFFFYSPVRPDLLSSSNSRMGYLPSSFELTFFNRWTSISLILS